MKATSKTSSSAVSERGKLIFGSLKGALVKVRLQDGRRLEGIFDACLEDGNCALTMVYEFAKDATIPTERIRYVFPLAEMQYFVSEPVSFNDNTSVIGVGTDTDISKATLNGRSCSPRELQRWEGEGLGEASGVDLEWDDSKGAQWDQFQANERLFGIRPSFDETQYTTTIDTSGDFDQREAEAIRIAQEIELGVNRGGSRNVHLAEERGVIFDDSQIDEEDRYGAVIRTDAAPPAQSAVSFSQAVCSTGSVRKGSPETFDRAARLSITNLNASPEAIDAALQEVHQTAATVQRRLSQMNIEVPAELQDKQEQFERQKRDTTNCFKAFSEKISCKLTQSGPEGSLDKTKLNPNASEFVPSSAPEHAPYIPVPPIYYVPYNPYMGVPHMYPPAGYYIPPPTLPQPPFGSVRKAPSLNPQAAPFTMPTTAPDQEPPQLQKKK